MSAELTGTAASVESDASRLGRVLLGLARRFRSEPALQGRVEAVAQAMAEAAAELVDADDVAIATMPPDSPGVLRVVGLAGRGEVLGTAIGAELPVSGTLSELALHGREPIETSQLLEAVPAFSREWVEPAGLNSARLVPMRLDVSLPDGRVIGGVMGVYRRSAMGFSQSERELIDGFGAIVAAELFRSQLQHEAMERLQKDASRSQQLETMKGEFLRLASHELRGPLAVARGYVDMVGHGDFGELPERVARVLPIVANKLTEMSMLIDQMLETARLEDHRLDLRRSPCDLRDLAEQAVSMLRYLSGPEHDITLEVPAHPVLVDGDSDRLVSILVNLVDNAVKYSPAGGAVFCRVGFDDGTAFAAVTDQGLGIAERDLARLFTRFGRIVTRHNSHIHGSGLGLYLAQRLAQMHGGEISVESEEGRGSTFTLWLPAAASHGDVPGPAA